MCVFDDRRLCHDRTNDRVNDRVKANYDFESRNEDQTSKMFVLIPKWRTDGIYELDENGQKGDSQIVKMVKMSKMSKC